MGQRCHIEGLFQQHQESLHRHLFRLLRNEEDAQDMLQETYVRILQSQDAIQQEGNPKAYLFKIATNLVIDKSRKEQRQQREKHFSANDGELPCNGPSPHAQAQTGEALEKLKDALKELSPRCRQIFLLHRFKDMTYPEIAEKMGITTRTVERQMSIAMAFCRERMRGVL